MKVCPLFTYIYLYVYIYIYIYMNIYIIYIYIAVGCGAWVSAGGHFTVSRALGWGRLHRTLLHLYSRLAATWRVRWLAGSLTGPLDGCLASRLAVWPTGWLPRWLDWAPGPSNSSRQLKVSKKKKTRISWTNHVFIAIYMLFALSASQKYQKHKVLAIFGIEMLLKPWF